MSKARDLHWLATLCLLFGVSCLTGCSAVHTGSNSNTNWLARCIDDGSCDGASSCLCGTCTRTCVVNAECSAVSGSACISVRDDQLATSCGAAAPPSMKVCAATCTDDAACRALSTNLACLDGRCVVQTSSRRDAGKAMMTDASTAASDACAAGAVHSPCLSTTACAHDSDCAALASTCDSCSGLCRCGVADAGNQLDATLSNADLPACTWPAILDATDAARGSCHAARTLLKCNYTASAGATAICISNDVTQCGMQTSDCRDQCMPTEYGISCGAIGPAPFAPDATPAPDGCRSMGVTPGGTSYMCCPCASKPSVPSALQTFADDVRRASDQAQAGGGPVNCASALPALEVMTAADAAMAVREYVAAVLGVPVSELMQHEQAQACGDATHAACADIFNLFNGSFGGRVSQTVYPLAQQLDAGASAEWLTTFTSSLNGDISVSVLSAEEGGRLIGIAVFGGRATCTPAN